MIFTKIISTIIGCTLLAMPVFALQAQGFSNNTPPPGQTNNSLFEFRNPLNVKSVAELLRAVLDILLTIGIPIAVLFLVYAGFLFVWARGSDTGLKKAKDNLFYTVVGITLFMGAWFLAKVIEATLRQLGVPF